MLSDFLNNKKKIEIHLIINFFKVRWFVLQKVDITMPQIINSCGMIS